MAERKSFLLRLDGELLDELRRWADSDLRSLNGQMEFLLRKALTERAQGRALAAAAVESTADDRGRDA